jgi:hypothetical protein
MTKYNRKFIRNYLLGEPVGGEEGQREFEEQLMKNDELFEFMQIEEELLIENYLEGQLSPAEIESFKKFYLTTGEGRDKLEFTRALINFSQGRSGKRVAEKESNKEPENKTDSIDENSSEKSGFGQLISAFLFSLRNRPAVISLGVLGVVSLFALAFYFYSGLPFGQQLTPLEMEYARLNSGDLNDPARFKTSLSLLSGVSRGDGSSGDLPVLSNPKGNNENKVLFRLVLPIRSFPPGNKWKITLIRSEETVFRQDGVSSYPTKDGTELRLLLPAEVFQKGSYRLRAEPAEIENSRLTYPFSVK